MKTADLIKKTVFRFVEKGELFTSLDISQYIKKNGTFVRNITVRDWLRDNFYDLVNEADNQNLFSDPNIPDEFAKYETSSIRVRGGTLFATLYRPNWATDDDYNSRDQVPMTPGEVDKVAKATHVSKPVAPDISDLMDGKVDIVSRSINSLERIKIPGAITKSLGWSEGTVIDQDKAKLIKTDKPLPAGLKVNKDLRISIPRDVVNVPNPVKVRCDGTIITFEKA